MLDEDIVLAAAFLAKMIMEAESRHIFNLVAADIASGSGWERWDGYGMRFEGKSQITFSPVRHAADYVTRVGKL